MLLETEIFVVASKARPTLFIREDGESTERLEDAQRFFTRGEAEASWNELDLKHTFEVWPLKITISNL